MVHMMLDPLRNPDSDKMLESGEVFQKNRKWISSVVSCLISLISVVFTQFALFLLPLILPAASFLVLLPLSALVLVIVVSLGRFCKRVVGMRASAPAFVFFSILFIWTVYFSVVRQVVSSLVDILFNIEIIMVITGLYRIMSLDPGFVTNNDSCHDLFAQSPLGKVEVRGEELKISTSIMPQESPAEEVFIRKRTAKYCRYCKLHVMGFDHHCPAFGNCIGQRNHVVFVVLLVGFVASETSFAACASQFTAKSESESLSEVGRKATTRKLVLSTMLFCLVQVLWQVVFIMWHVYCACFNIKTDEWINWKKYPEFQIKVESRAGGRETGTRFMNPYDRGILKNMKEFLTAK